MAYSFDWDPEKAVSNRRKHHVTFDEAASVFDDPLAKVWYDEAHSGAEDRFLIIGHSLLHRLLVVIFGMRPGETIRIISARRATRKECREYQANQDRANGR